MKPVIYRAENKALAEAAEAPNGIFHKANKIFRLLNETKELTDEENHRKNNICPHIENFRGLFQNVSNKRCLAVVASTAPQTLIKCLAKAPPFYSHNNRDGDPIPIQYVVGRHKNFLLRVFADYFTIKAVGEMLSLKIISIQKRLRNYYA